MPAPLNDDSKVMFGLLRDRRWHDYERVVSAIAARVPPGRALRKYEQYLRLSAKHRRNSALANEPLVDPAVDDDDRIARGAQRCAYATVSNWRRAGVLDVRNENETEPLRKEIRVKPGFSSPSVPGFEEPAAEPHDSPPEGPGPTEVPPEDSEPSEGDGEGPNEPLAVEVLGSEPEDVVGIVKGEDGRWRVTPVDRIKIEEWMAEEQVRDLDGDYSASPYAWPKVGSEKLTECPDCGLAIGDEQVHDQWHQNLRQATRGAEMALLDESQLRELLRDVTEQVMARFQQGMQGWLIQQFTQLMMSLAPPATGTQRWTDTDPRGAGKG